MTAPPSPTLEFSRSIAHWQRKAGRHDLPWQHSRDPYLVWLSEIMLQQTQARTVQPYFLRFQARFPDVHTLANAPLDEVLALWSGLGYYARARNLHDCARRVVEEHGGRFPSSARALAELPGIGRSTAAAIAVFAFGERAAILDGNVKRVFCRHFGIEGAPVGAVEKSLWTLAESLLPPAADMTAYTQGLMDLGATCCLPRHPRCDACPVATSCAAHQAGREMELPTPRTPRAKPQRSAVFLLVTDGERLFLQQRPPRGIWGGLYAPPEGTDWQTRLGLEANACHALPPREHVFTHFRLTIHPLLCRVECLPTPPAPDWHVLTFDEARRAGIPAPVARLLDETENVLRETGQSAV